MAAKQKVIPVTPIALRRRIVRALAAQGRELRADRGGQHVRWLVIDSGKQAIVQADVDLEALGREIGALRAWEEVR